MSIHQDKNGTWYIKYNNLTRRGFSTKEEAIKFEKVLKLDSQKIEKPLAFEDVVEHYLNYCYHNVEYGTYTKRKRFFEKIITPYFKKRNIRTINEIECLEFRNYIQELRYSTRYKNNIIEDFKLFYKYAKRIFQLERNPSEVVDRFKKTHIEKVEDRERKNDIWTPEEFERFIKEVDDEIYKKFFIVVYFTGIRLGEALALQWKDYKDGCLFITKSITTKVQNGRYMIKEPKSEASIRKIRLNQSLDNYLLIYKKQEQKDKRFKDDWFIFYRLNPLPDTTITRKKDEAIKRSGVRRIRLHDFRHSHASNLIGNGVDIVAVSKRLGHSDVSITLSIYTHLLEKNNEKLTNCVEESSQNLLKKL